MSQDDFFERRRIADAELENARVTKKLENHQADVEELKKTVKKLSMTCKALWQLLQETSDIPQWAFEEKFEQIEQESAERAATCPGCSRVRQKRIPHCIYCGTPFDLDMSHRYFGI
ncbi:MAG: hypothetical protein AB4050_08120 [Synechococcus sp.]